MSVLVSTENAIAVVTIDRQEAMNALDIATVRELSATILLTTSETKVMSVLIFDLKESGDVGAIAVISLTMIVLTAIAITAANRFGNRREASRLLTRA